MTTRSFNARHGITVGANTVAVVDANGNITANTILVGGASLNSTSFAGTANNASNLNGQPASFYTNANNLSTGVINVMRLPTSGVTANVYGNSSSIPVVTVDTYGRVTSISTSAVAGVTSFVYTGANNTLSLGTGDGSTYTATIAAANSSVAGVVTIIDSVSNTSSLVAASANSVKNAYDRAIDANTRAASAQTAAISAYSNAVSYTDAAIVTANVAGAAGVAYTNAVSYAANVAATAYSNAVSVAASDATSKANNAYTTAVSAAASDATSKAAAAYTNAVSTASTDATAKSANAYSNAVSVASSDATSKAANAYSNAVSIAASDATTKANNAYTTAIAAAAIDATGKAANAYTNAVSIASTDATSKANNAYTTAISVATSTASSDATTKANNAYVQAVSVAASDASSKASNAYSNAVSVASSDATAKAANAYSNAVTFASNATNISSGTLAEPRLPFRMNQDVRTTDSVTFANASFNGTVSVSGNLIVTGNLESTNVQTLAVSDPLIKLGVNNPADTSWGGFTFHYSGSGNTTNHAGLVRNPSTKEFLLMSTFGDEVAVANNNTINVSDPSFSYANLQVSVLTAQSASIGGATINSTAYSGSANNTAYLGTYAANTYPRKSEAAAIDGAWNFSSGGAIWSGHSYTNTYDGSNVYQHIGTATGTNKIWNLRVFKADNTVSTFVFNSAGVATAENSFRAPIFYDTDNTSYYFDGASTSAFNVGTFAGCVTISGTGSIGTNLQLVSSGASPNIQFARSGYQNWFMGSPNNSADLGIAEGSANSYVMYFKSGGNVGIGTASPMARFVVSNGSNENIEFTAGSAVINGGVIEYINRADGSRPDLNYYLGTSGAHKFYTSGAERMRINSSGNLLLGTTTARTRLTVSGVESAAPTLGTATGAAILMNTDSAYGMMFGVAGAGYGWIQQQRVDATATAYDLILQPSGGNVGIGTTSTEAKLHVSGTARFEHPGDKVMEFVRSGTNTFSFEHDTSRLYLYNATTANTIIAFSNLSNVGIGTLSPDFKLDVRGTVASNADVRGPIFYDSGNTSFYVDPTGTSVVNGFQVNFVGAANGYDQPTLFRILNSDDNWAFGAYQSGSEYWMQTQFYGVGDDNRGFRVLDKNGGVVRFRVNGAGSAIASADMRAPIFYDSNDTGYYADPNSTSRFKRLVIDDGDNLSWGGVYGAGVPTIAATTNTALYFYPTGSTAGTTFTMFGTYAIATGSMRAPLFYDSDNTNYYLDPASTSVLGGIVVNGALDIRDSNPQYWRSTNGAYQRVDSRTEDTSLARAHWYGVSSAGATSNFRHAWYDGSQYFNVTADSSQVVFTRTSGTGSLVSSGDIRTPIYYDSNNTAYYADLAGSTIVGTLFAKNSAGTNWKFGYSSYFGYSSGYGALIIGDTSGNITPCFNVDPIANPSGSFNGGGSEVMFRNGVTFITPNSSNNGYHFPINMTDGYVSSPGSFRAPIFYDSGDTGYYLDPNTSGTSIRVGGSAYFGLAVDGDGVVINHDQIWTPGGNFHIQYSGSGNLQLMNGGGSVKIGPFGTPSYKLHVAGTIYSENDVRAPIFYDSNDTNYYLDPAGTSQIAYIRTGNVINIGGVLGDATIAGTNFHGIELHSEGNRDYYIGKPAGAWTQPLHIHFYTGVWYRAHRAYGGHQFYDINDGGLKFSIANQDGNVRSLSNFYAPVMYDIDDTAFYLDPASSSYLGIITAKASNDIQLYLNGNGTSWTGISWADVAGTDYIWYNGSGSTFAIGGGGSNVANKKLHIHGGVTIGSGIAASASGVNSLYVQESILAGGNITLDAGWSGENGTFRIREGGDNNYGGYIKYTASDTLEFGTRNGSTTDVAGFYISRGTAAMYSPIVYDSNNTAFYTDPASTTALNSLSVNGSTVFQSNWTTRFQSPSDFANGTLVTTDIPATAENGDSFIIEITGKSYGGGPSTKVVAEGYLYANTIINAAGISYGGPFASSIKVFQDGGVLKFWWPRISYWNSFNVNVMSMDGPTNSSITRNRVTAIGNSTEPTGTKKVTITLATNMRADISATNSVDLRSPIFYDSNNTGYYIDPTGSTSLRMVGDIRMDSSTWTGEFNGKLQYHANNWYFQSANEWILRRSDGNSALIVSQAGFGSFLSDIRVGSAQSSSNIYMGDSDEGERRIHCNSNRIGFLSQADNWGAFCEDSGVWATDLDMRSPIYYDRNDTGYYVDPNSTSRMNLINADTLRSYTNIYTDNNYGYGLVGVYSSYRYQGVFAMGDAYKLPADGTTTGSLYGIAWSHPNAGGTAGNLNTHGALILENGGFLAALSGSIRCRDDMRTPIYYDSENTGYYTNPNSTSSMYYVSVDRAAAGYDAGVSGSFSCSNWFRSNGSTGWFNASYGGGVFMEDGTYVRVYNGKALYVPNEILATGNITAYYSDERLKTRIGNISGALDKVLHLEGFFYTENETARELGYDNDRQQVGVSAQKVQEVLPEAVHMAPVDVAVDEDGNKYSKTGENYLTVDYSRIVPLLIEAIKEQQLTISEQSAKINTLEHKLEQLIQKLEG